MSQQGIRILIVDDEPIVRKSLGSWLQEEGYEVDVAESGKETLEKLAGGSWDIFLIDIKMPGMDGLDLQRRIREAHPDAAIIIMTAYASAETAVEAMKQGAHDYIIKPFEPEKLEHVIRSAAERKDLLRESRGPRGSDEVASSAQGVLGVSPAMREVLDRIRSAADTDAAVLLRGESGTGKDLVARAIHASSKRRYMPLVTVSCGALSGADLELELFGHEKGALPGATYQRKGKLELADGGTLFLDEIADLSVKAQAEVLRVLEEKKVTRVGGSKPAAADFRLIAATKGDPEALLAKKALHEAFYYRVSIFSITLPPLRERPEDIPFLARHFAEKHARAMGKTPGGLSPEAMDFLARRDWPGNVRELENTVERAVILCKAAEISLQDVSPAGQGGSPPAPGSSPAEADIGRIRKALEDADWNVSRAARILGVEKAALFEKMKEHGIQRKG
jgi:DNA-binding NtrC family response regulator